MNKHVWTHYVRGITKTMLHKIYLLAYFFINSNRKCLSATFACILIKTIFLILSLAAAKVVIYKLSWPFSVHLSFNFLSLFWTAVFDLKIIYLYSNCLSNLLQITTILLVLKTPHKYSISISKLTYLLTK